MKIYDVVNFDMTLDSHAVRAHRVRIRVQEGARQKIAVGAPDGKIHVYDGANGDQTPVHTLELHRAAVRCVKYNAAKRCCISSDDRGVIEYWSPATYEAPAADEVEFRFKLDTDLYALAKAKTKALSMEVSHDGEQFSTLGPDRKVRVFRFATASYGASSTRLSSRPTTSSARVRRRTSSRTSTSGGGWPWTGRWATIPIWRLGSQMPYSTGPGTSCCTPRCSE